MLWIKGDIKNPINENATVQEIKENLLFSGKRLEVCDECTYWLSNVWCASMPCFRFAVVTLIFCFKVLSNEGWVNEGLLEVLKLLNKFTFFYEFAGEPLCNIV